MKPLGVVMAGGRNTRYGGLKAFAEVGGARIVDRVIGALRCVNDDVVMIANDVTAYESIGLEIRPDAVADAAALGGLLSALRWATERQTNAAIIVACDMPFVPGELLRAIVSRALSQDADVCAPESGGRRGIEPLCAWYSTRCLGAIEAAIARDDLRMIGFHADVRTTTLPVAEVHAFGDPARLFLNVNTRDDLQTAQMLATQPTQ